MISSYVYFGYIGSFLTTLMLIPQVYKVFKYKDITSLSIIYLHLQWSSSLFYLLYAVNMKHENDILPLIISNSSCMTCGIALIYAYYKYQNLNPEYDML